MTTARKGSAEQKAVPHTRLDDDSMLNDYYETNEKLGEGAFGKVYAGTHKETGVRWAIKAVNKEKAGSSGLKLLEREVAILKRVCHGNIIRLNEVLESSKKMYLVMEICEGGELADCLKDKKFFTEPETKVIMTKLISAISYLHKHDIVHRDLKLENILLSVNPDDPDDKLHIKVTDFGLSVVKGGVGHDNMMQDFCGTPIYMSPEIIDNKTYSQQCDVWAAGVIMFILLTGNSPFNAKNDESLYDLIKAGELNTADERWSTISDEARDCIQRMLKVDPAHRLTASEVLNHQWITGNSEASQSINVLDLMKAWAAEMKEPQTESSAINGESEASQTSSNEENNVQTSDLSDGVVASASEQPVPTNGNRKGSGGTKKTTGGSKTPPGSSTKPGMLHSRQGSNKSTLTSSATPTPRASTKSLKPNAAGSSTAPIKSPSGSKTATSNSSKSESNSKQVGTSAAKNKRR